VISIDTTTGERWKEGLSGKENIQDTKRKRDWSIMPTRKLQPIYIY
jgi:hypothetical protein